MNAATYTELSKQGQAAEAEVHGVVRGGFILNGTFYAHAGSRGVIQVPVAAVRSLKIH